MSAVTLDLAKAHMKVDGTAEDELIALDLPLKFHPAAIRASAVFDTPDGAVGATGGNA